jgi:hypothetical protein
MKKSKKLKMKKISKYLEILNQYFDFPKESTSIVNKIKSELKALKKVKNKKNIFKWILSKKFVSKILKIKAKKKVWNKDRKRFFLFLINFFLSYQKLLPRMEEIHLKTSLFNTFFKQLWGLNFIENVIISYEEELNNDSYYLWFLNTVFFFNKFFAFFYNFLCMYNNKQQNFSILNKSEKVAKLLKKPKRPTMIVEIKQTARKSAVEVLVDDALIILKNELKKWISYISTDNLIFFDLIQDNLFFKLLQNKKFLQLIRVPAFMYLMQQEKFLLCVQRENFWEFLKTYGNKNLLFEIKSRIEIVILYEAHKVELNFIIGNESFLWLLNNENFLSLLKNTQFLFLLKNKKLLFFFENKAIMSLILNKDFNLIKDISDEEFLNIVKEKWFLSLIRDEAFLWLMQNEIFGLLVKETRFYKFLKIKNMKQFLQKKSFYFLLKKENIEALKNLKIFFNDINSLGFLELINSIEFKGLLEVEYFWSIINKQYFWTVIHDDGVKNVIQNKLFKTIYEPSFADIFQFILKNDFFLLLTKKLNKEDVAAYCLNLKIDEDARIKEVNEIQFDSPWAFLLEYNY